MKHLAIIGGGDSGLIRSWPLEGEIWSINNFCIAYPKIPWTRIFEVHAFTCNNGVWLRRGESSFRGMSIDAYINSLNATKLPVYVLPHPECPFPTAVIINIKDRRYRSFFSTTVSYMLATAIDENFESVELIGIDLSLTEEYRNQRPSVTYFVGLAEGRGIKVSISKGSPLLSSPFYGIETGKISLWDQRIASMHRYIDTESAKHHNMLEQYKGAKTCLETIKEFYTLLQEDL